MPPALQRDALLELVPALIDKYGDTSSEAAAQWYEQVREKWFTDDGYEAVVAEPVSHDALTSSVRAKANMLWPQDEDYDPEGYLRYLTEVVDRNVKRGGRDTIIANGRRDRRKPRFARVPSGAKTCAFCSMLASRGFVYLSEQTAGALGQYHADCDCEIVPSWDKSPKVEGYDPEVLYKDYELARRQAGDNPTTADILAAMRRQPNKYTDGVQPRIVVPDRWKQPHAQNEERLLSMKELAAVSDAEWYRRQELAGVAHSIDTLYPHEIVFLERFKEHGNHIEWISHDLKAATPTNDFNWIEQGESFELKSLTKANFSRIADRITKSVRSAKQNHGVVKDCFVIDLGNSSRSDKLVRQLENYNRRDYKIRRLFILDGEGLMEIDLK